MYKLPILLEAAWSRRLPTKRSTAGLCGIWGKATALALVVAGFLGWYDAVRNNGRLFVCDAAALFGQSDAVSFCRADVAPPDDSNQLALLEYLKVRVDQLSPERLEQLRQLEAYFEDRAFAELREAAGLERAAVGKTDAENYDNPPLKL